MMAEMIGGHLIVFHFVVSFIRLLKLTGLCFKNYCPQSRTIVPGEIRLEVWYVLTMKQVP
ncbi:hypothetical protein BJX64DRAFT_250652 [Aspergillus heterothallicus]